jgi:hypothetical protein
LRGDNKEGLSMRRFLSFGAIVAFLGTASGAFAQQIQVIVNGGQVQFEGQGPTMVGDRVLVPLRGVLQRMGAHVDWDPSTQTVSAMREGSLVKLTIGENTASVDGQPVNLDVPAQIMEGSTMVPLRFLGEALGEDVHWDSASNTVSITGGAYHARHDGHDPNWRPGSPPPPPLQHGPPPPLPPAQYYAPPDAVLPVSINISLDSGQSRPGQRFTAVVGHYPGLPDGCRVEGVVAGVSSQVGIELNFDTLIGPHGTRYPIHGQATELNGPSVVQRPNGQTMGTGRTNRIIFANRGGRAALVPVNSRGALQDPRVAREIQKKGGAQRPVTIQQGTTFGVRLDAGVKVH